MHMYAEWDVKVSCVQIQWWPMHTNQSRIHPNEVKKAYSLYSENWGLIHMNQGRRTHTHPVKAAAATVAPVPTTAPVAYPIATAAPLAAPIHATAPTLNQGLQQCWYLRDLSRKQQNKKKQRSEQQNAPHPPTHTTRVHPPTPPLAT